MSVAVALNKTKKEGLGVENERCFASLSMTKYTQHGRVR